MVRHRDTFKDTQPLLPKSLPPDPVEMKHPGMRAQTRQNRRLRMLPSPLDNYGKAVPPGFIAQVPRARFRARNDKSVQMAVPQTPEARITIANIRTGPVGSLDIGQRKKPQTYLVIARRRIQQSRKLALCRLQSGVRHVIDQTNINASRCIPVSRTIMRQTNGHQHFPAVARSAWSRSASMSSICSMPTLSRIISGFTPA